MIQEGLDELNRCGLELDGVKVV